MGHTSLSLDPRYVVQVKLDHTQNNIMQHQKKDGDHLCVCDCVCVCSYACVLYVFILHRSTPQKITGEEVHLHLHQKA